MKDVRPYIIIPFLLFCMIYVTIQSSPRMNMQSTEARILAVTCYGNQAPYGCTLEVEYNHNSTMIHKSITGSYNKKYHPYDDVELWINKSDSEDILIERKWNKDGLMLLFMLSIGLLLYLFSMASSRNTIPV